MVNVDISSINFEETELMRSYLNPSNEKIFGEIRFSCMGKEVCADLYDRYTDEVSVIGDLQVATLRLKSDSREQFHVLVETICSCDCENGKYEIPNWLFDVLEKDF